MRIKYFFSNIFIIGNILSFTLLGCDQSHVCFDKYLDNQATVIVPAIGCGGCIESTLQFLRDHHESKRLKFVFTRYKNDRELRLFIGEKLYHSPGRINQSDFPEDCRWLYKDHPVVFYNNTGDPDVIMPANKVILLDKLNGFLGKDE